jgi:hypothetical protein
VSGNVATCAPAPFSPFTVSARKGEVVGELRGLGRRAWCAAFGYGVLLIKRAHSHEDEDTCIECFLTKLEYL